jgi:hypothetical protein
VEIYPTNLAISLLHLKGPVAAAGVVGSVPWKALPSALEVGQDDLFVAARLGVNSHNLGLAFDGAALSLGGKSQLLRQLPPPRGDVPRAAIAASPSKPI